MTDSNHRCERISRRAVLANAALALGATASAVAATQATAQTKISQAEAKYQASPKGQQSCAVCVQFQPPNACKFVQGTISPTGWCQLFAAKT
jgi:hypothetical protein